MIRSGLLLLAPALVALGFATSCDSGDGREVRPAGPDQTATLVRPSTTTTPPDPAVLGSGLPGDGVGEGALTLRAPWEDEGVIDVGYTCASSGGTPGTGTSPALSWSGVPAGATNLALVVTDLAATGFVHWVAVGIDPTSTGVAEGQAPIGAAQGTNGFGAIGWGGPCPPAGSGEHPYLFVVHALDEELGLSDGFAAEAAITDIEAASIGSVSLVGRFTLAAADPTTTLLPTTPPTPATPPTTVAAVAAAAPPAT